MNIRKPRNLIVMLAATGIAAFAFAQSGGGARFFDPSTETTVQGTVTAVADVPRNGGWHGLHLNLQTEDGAYEVHVGPSEYVSQRGFVFSQGDRVQVTGSKVTLNGVNSLIAREVRKDAKVLQLRDKQGFPMWSRARQMGPPIN